MILLKYQLMPFRFILNFKQMQLKTSPFLKVQVIFIKSSICNIITFIEVTSTIIQSLLCLYFIIVCTNIYLYKWNQLF